MSSHKTPSTWVDEHWVKAHWQGDTQVWFQSLIDAALIGFEWPAPFGLSWPRDQQHQFVSLLVKHQCPLMPESLTVIAPLLLQFGSEAQKQLYLPSIQASPLAWSFGGDTVNRCWLDPDDDTLMIALDKNQAEMLGEPGQGFEQLAQSNSPALLLHEYLLGLAYLPPAADDETQAVSELRLQADVLNAHFLRATLVTDAQLALLVTRSRLTLFAELFDSMGYYALIDPEALPGDNEPIPFSHERSHLRVLRTLTTRDEMMQQDQIYQAHLNGTSE